MFVRSGLVLSAVVAGMLVLSCSPESPKLVEMPVVVKERVKNTGGDKVTFSRSVDILFVVDDSGSMGSHQQSLAKNVALFTQAIIANQILDYHIGVVSSTMSSQGGVLRGSPNYVTRTTPNAATVLQANMQPGTSGDTDEKFYEPIKAALTPPQVGGVNAGFFRPDAYLAIVIITDTEDWSNVTGKDFYQMLLNLKRGDPTKVLVYAAYSSSKDTTCGHDDAQRGILEGLFKESNAKTFGLCDPDFGVKLGALGVDLVSKIGSVLYLTRPPQPDTISVVFGTQTIPNDPKKGWVFDPFRNALIFGEDIDLQPEPPGTEVEVSFTAAQY